jgi:hypothetical protein
LDDLEQPLDLWVGELMAEWIHVSVCDIPILNKECPSGHIPCLVRPKDPKMLLM